MFRGLVMGNRWLLGVGLPFCLSVGGVTCLGHIVKWGSCWFGRVLVEVVHVVVRMVCRFKGMFWCITSGKCRNVAYVVVVCKMLAVIWHLFFDNELFVGEVFSKAAVLV
jgi:hypothetical protein